MKWMLIVIVAGTPVKTELLFDTLAACIAAEDAMRQAYANDFNAWVESAKADPKKYHYPESVKDFMANKIHPGVCIPHNEIRGQ